MVVSGDVLVYNMQLRRPACVLLAAAMDGNPDFAKMWPSEDWIVGEGADGLRRYGPMDRAMVERIATADREHAQ